MDYQDGFEDGVKFAREVIVNNIRLWAETSEDGPAYDDCDQCSVAQAMYLIKLLDGELAFCGHHYNMHKEALDKKAYEIIQLNKVEEDIPQLEKAE